MANQKTSRLSQALQDKIVLVVLAMMIVVPFVAAPLDGISAGAAALICESFGIALLVIVMWRRKPQITSESLASFLKTAGNVPALVFLGIVGVSLARSAHFSFSVQEALRLATGILIYFVVAYQFRRSEHITKVVDLLVVIALGVSFVTFLQYGTNQSSAYATGLFGDHQLLGSFLMLLLPFVCTAAMMERDTNRQLIAQIAACTTIVALLISQARSAWLGTGAGVAALAIITLWSARRRSQVVRSKHEVVLPVMLLVVSVAFFFLISPEAGHIGDRMQKTINPTGESAVAYRSQLAKGALAMIKDRPMTGQGVGLYPMYQAQFTNSGMAVWLLHDKKGHYARPGMGETAHNLYLQTAAELGIPGAVVFFAIPVLFLIGAVIKVRTMDHGVRRNVLLASIASIVAFMVDAAASPSWQYGQISMFMWVIMGLGVGSLRPRHRRFSASREAEEQTELAPSPARSAMRGLGVVMGVTLACVMIPSVIYALPSQYLIPKSADIEPKNAEIFSFQQQAFTLTVTFTDNSVYDVTASPQTTFLIVGNAGGGSLTGNTYQASSGPATVTIEGEFTQQGITVSNSTFLFVVRAG